MEIGTGIFLSSLVLGTIALFAVTKDRWRWKRIVLYGAGGAVTVIALGTLSLQIADKWKNWEAQFVKQHQLWGIKLGSSKDDVMFLKGVPFKGSKEDIWAYQIKEGYGTDTINIVGFKDGKVAFVQYNGESFRSGAPSFGNLGIGSSLESVTLAMGEPTYISRSADGLLREYSFDKLNIFFRFMKGNVVALGIFDATTGPMRFADELVPLKEAFDPDAYLRTRPTK